MKILVLSYRIPPYPGAASARAGSIAEALKRRGHEVVMPRLWTPRLEYTGYLNRLLIYLGFVLSYWWYLLGEAGDYDWLYYVSPWALSVFSLPACLWGRFEGMKVALDVHDVITLGTGSRFLANKVIHVEDSLLGIDTDTIKPSPERNDRFVVMCSGNPQGYDIEAFDGASKALPTLTFEALKFGDYPRGMFLSELSKASIFFMPSKPDFDQMPTKVAEYMALGRPIVFIGEGKMAQIIRERYVGFSVPRGGFENAISCIRFLSESQDMREEMGKRARETAEELFSMDAFGERLEKMLN